MKTLFINQYDCVKNHVISVFICCLCITNAKANVGSYTFAQSNSTYTSISGTVLFASTTSTRWDDGVSAAQTLPFTFTYNNAAYTNLIVNANGYITMGSTSTTTANYCGLQASDMNSIGGYATDLVGGSLAATSNIQVATLGTAPNRKYVIQWNDCAHWTTGTYTDHWSFQIILYETTNKVEVVWGNSTNLSTMVANNCADAATESGSVGLLGNATSDYNLRSVTNGTNTWATSVAGTAINAVCNMSSSNIPVQGLTYTWTPAPPVNMSFQSATTSFINSNTSIPVGSTNNPIIKIQVITNGSLNPVSLTSLTISTNGSSNALSDISNAKIYYTGVNTIFNTSTQFGTTKVNPNGSFTVTGNATLLEGINNFWITFDIKNAATLRDTLRACCSQLIGTGSMGTVTPTITCPVGYQTINATGKWYPVTNLAPASAMGHMLLLSDGTALCKSNTGASDSYGNTFMRLTPDANGSYINGTWSTIAPMHDSRLWFSSQVLKDGRMYVAGGEYGTGLSTAEVYNPITNTWTYTPSMGSTISDANSEILEDGRVLQALVAQPLTATKIYNPKTNTLVTGPTALGIHNESSWLKLPDNSILFVDRLTTSSERYIPATNTWIADATLPVQLYDPYGDETGAAFLLPDGRGFFIGAMGHTAYYTPSGNTSNGTWTVGPDIPNNTGTPDAGAAMMINGKIIMAVSPVPTSANHFPSPTTFYEFDYLTNSFSSVSAPDGSASINEGCYTSIFLDLPDGNVLYGRLGTNQYFVYKPTGATLEMGRPIVNIVNQIACDSLTVIGTQFNGISQGACYGDDGQMSTNYPLVRLTSGSNVYYATTSNWNSTGVMRGSKLDTVQVKLPQSLPSGTYTLEVIANGISSFGKTFTVKPSLSSNLNAGQICSGATFTYTPTSTTSNAQFTWTRAAVAGISNAAITTAQTNNPTEQLINTTALAIDVIYSYTIVAGSCSNTQNVVVTVKPSLNSVKSDTVCSNNLPYVWNGFNLTASGTKVVQLTNSSGCDSIATLNLTVKQATASTTNISIHPVSLPYTWNGLTYTTGGSKTAHLTNKVGCDSAATLNLTILTSVSSTTNLSICPNQLPYTWNGLTFTAAGTQTAYFAAKDSAATLNLTVKSNSVSTNNLSICPSQLPYIWNGLTFTAAGTQTAHLINSVGCDSAATLNLTVKANTASTTTIVNCSNILPYTWNGLTFTAAGTQTAHLINKAGCDSAATLTLVIQATITSTTNLSICPNQLPYTWNGLNFTAAGSKTAMLKNSYNCDSAATLNLTVKAVSTSLTNLSICSNLLPYVWNGLTFTTSGTQTAHLTNSVGCDSAATLNLTVKAISTSSNNLSVCSNLLPYVWNGLTFTAAGTKTAHLTNSMGCDSAATLNLTVKSISTSSNNLSICPSQLPYIWNGLTFTTASIQTAHLINSVGCDSAATLNLKLKPSIDTTITKTACGSYTWNGITFTTSGIYSYNGTNSVGCDSIVHLNLTINALPATPTITASGSTNLCQGDSVLLTANSASGGIGTWVQKASTGISRYGGISFSIGSKGYVGLGYTGSFLNDLWEYEPTTDVWTQKAAFPSTAGGRFGAAGFSIANKAYVAMGLDGNYSYNSEVWEYNAATNTWVQKTNFPGNARYLATASVTNGKSYLCCGQNYSTSTYYNDLWEYNNTTDTWTQKSSLPSSARNNLSSFALGNNLYVGLGYTGSVFLNDWWQYNTSTDTWVQKNNFTGTARNSAISSVLNNKGYVAFGSSASGSLNDFWSYNETNDNWTQINTNTSTITARYFANSFVVNNALYVGNGYNGSYLSDVWQYKVPLTYTWSNGATTQSINVKTAGNYTVTVTNADGCSATSAATTVKVGSNTTSTTNISVHPVSLPYIWNGLIFTKTESQTAHLINSQGCDSAATLNLTVITTKSSTSNLTICSNLLPYSWNGLTFTTAGSQTAYFAANDSAATLNLTVKDTTSSTTTQAACGSYTWNGVTFTASGTYRYKTTNKAGCDSTAYLNLTINALPATPTITANNSTTLCQGDSVILTANSASGGTGTWVQKASIGVGRYGGISFSIGSKGYVGLGYANGSHLTDLWEYDPSTDIWTQKAIYPSTNGGVWGASGFSIGNKGYVAMGELTNNSDNAEVWEYNPTSNTWLKKANFPGAAHRLSSVSVINGKAYIACGYVSNTGSYINELWEYYAATDTWVQKNSFPGTARDFNSSITIGTNLYVGLGYNGSALNDWWQYNTTTNTWVQKNNFTGTARYGAIANVVGGKGYIAFGNDANSFLNDFWSYNEAADTWTPINTNTSSSKRFLSNSFVVNNTLFVGNGLDANYNYLSDLWQYQLPLTYTWSNGAITQSINIKTAGNYSVTVTDNNGCSATSAATTVIVNSTTTPTINITTASQNVCYLTKTIFTANSTNGGTTPIYKWYKNGIIVGGNANSYADSLLNNNDSVWCVLISNAPCITTATIKSNTIKMTVSLAFTGMVKSPKNLAINKVSLYRSGTVKDTQSVNGTYYYTCLNNTSNGTIKAYKNNDAAKANGVNSVDALLVQRHILNTTKLNNAYKIIAADVDGNKTINSVDVLRIKRLILGTDTTFKNTVTNENRLWAFVDSSYQFPDTTNPFPFKDSISFANLSSIKNNQTFIGIKLGDVNFDWNSTVAKPSTANPLQLLVVNKQVVNNEQSSIVRTNSNINCTLSTIKSEWLSAMQATIHFDNTLYEFIGITNNQLNIDFNTTQANKTGNISLVWIDKNGRNKQLDENEMLFTLVLRPISTNYNAIPNIQFSLNDDITPTTAYDEVLNKRAIVLIQEHNTINSTNINSFAIYPNPAKTAFTVFINDKTDKTQLIITDVLGKQIHTQILNAGNNQIAINNWAKGIYYVTILVNDNKQTQKLIVE